MEKLFYIVAFLALTISPFMLFMNNGIKEGFLAIMLQIIGYVLLDIKDKLLEK